MGKFTRLLKLGNSHTCLRIWLLRMVVIACVYLAVLLIPKPVWLCDESQAGGNGRGKILTSQLFQVFLDDSKQTTRGPIKHQTTRLLDMFPLYFNKDRRSNENDTFPVLLPKKAVAAIHHQDKQEFSPAKVFYLQNLDFSGFGRTWLNEVVRNETVGNTRPKSSNPRKKQYDGHNPPSINIRQLRKYQRLPDCVSLHVSHAAVPTKICVHYPYHDNFISNSLRDTGEWEMDLVFQMEEFFRTYPETQLVDLGCNIGVFTLFAASLGKPALAVDILPSNLALIQLSIATNDDAMTLRDPQDEDVEGLLQSMGYERKNRPRYSDLITTLHNAVYSKRMKMYVYLKGDLNLGGTEVKEYNIHVEDKGAQKVLKPTATEIIQGIKTPRSQTDNEEAMHVTISDSSPDGLQNGPSSAPDGTQILVDAVCLDDLVPYIRPNASVFLKMDIEGSEPDAFMCASNFFMLVDVRVLLMEILFHRYSSKGKDMAKFLLYHNMLPAEDMNGRKLLDANLEKMYSWPENMFWVKVR